jgi:hypothetical protein
LEPIGNARNVARHPSRSLPHAGNVEPPNHERLAVPLSRFPPRVGGGSAFYVRQPSLNTFPTNIIKPQMKTKWFKRFGWFYLPVSVAGAVVCLLAIIFCLTVFTAVDRHSHSASDTLYGVFPFFICTFLLLDWLGSRSSE